MDALAYLALMAKAKLVFENPDTFMCFPALAPVRYTTDQLNFGAFNSPAVAQRLVYSEFSRLVNALPSGTIFEPGDKFLWDTYDTILRTAILAEDQMSDTENAAYQQAVAFLGGTNASGLPVPSPELLAYRQFRDVWFQAVQSYKAQQSTAMAATDEAALTQWQNVDEPQLRALVEQARSDWQAKGFKEPVEQAQRVQQTYSARSPRLIWHTWSSSFDPDLDLQTDPNQQSFALTSFVPADAFSQEWLTFRITNAEIAQLVAQAPKELKDMLAPEGSESTVDQISFEFRSVSLSRPWFRPEIFGSRFWRMPEGTTPFSDGADPPEGQWPAYIAALVFLRNIQVTMRTGATIAPPQRLWTLPALQMVAAPSPTSTMRLAPAVFESRQTDSPRNAMAQPNIATPAAVRSPLRAEILRQTVQPAPRAIQRMRWEGRPIFETAPVPPPPPTPEPPPPPEPEPDPRKDISILAFICKQLPKSPNPDPSLTW